MLRDTSLIYRSELAITLRNKPYWVMGAIQPVLSLVLFGPLLAIMMTRAPGVTEMTSWSNLTPALIIQVAATNGIYSGFLLMQRLRAGTIDRLRVTPVSRASLSLGSALPPVNLTLIQSSIILIIAGAVFGVGLSVVGVLLVLSIAALTALAIAACSHAIAMKLGNEDAFSGVVNITILPLTLLSGILLPITPDTAPTWLYILSRINPLAYVVDISRASFAANLPLVATVVGASIVIGLTAAAVRWSTSTYQNSTA